MSSSNLTPSRSASSDGIRKRRLRHAFPPPVEDQTSARAIGAAIRAIVAHMRSTGGPAANVASLRKAFVPVLKLAKDGNPTARMLVAHARRHQALASVLDPLPWPAASVDTATKPPSPSSQQAASMNSTSSSFTGPCFTVPGVSAARLAEELANQASLVADLQRYLSEGGPSPAELDAAPQMEGWSLVPSGNGVIIAGRISGHPRIGSHKYGHTAQIAALARDGNWARSLNRLWKLGTPHEPMVAGHA